MRVFKKLLGYLQRNDGSLTDKTIRSGFWVGISNVGINSLAFVRSIILARLLMPEAFGLMTLCFMVLRSIDTFTQSGFSAALIHRQKDIEDAKDTAFVTFVVRGFLLALLTYLIAPLFAAFYEKSTLELMVKILAINFIIRGFKNINTISLEKSLDFKRITYFEQASALVNFLIITTLVYFYRSVWALVAASVLSAATEIVFSYIFIPGRGRLRFDKNIAKELLSYGRFMSGAGILVFITTEIDNAVVGKILNMEALGYYVMAYTLANLPATHISSIVSKVIFPAYSSLQNDMAALRVAYLKVLNVVSLFVIPTATGMIVLAPEIIKLVYGEKWLPSVGVLQILCVFGVIRSIAGTTGSVFAGIGRPNIVFYSISIRLSVMILLFYPLTRQFDIIGSSCAVTVAIVIEQIFLWIVFVKVTKLEILSIIKQLSPQLIASMIMATVIYVMKTITVIEAIPSFIGLILLGGICYFFIYCIINIDDARFVYLKIKQVF